LAVQWTAAGFDPEAFWRQTLRGVQRALRGAALRRKRARADAAEAAFVGHHADQRGLQSFFDALEARPKTPIPPEQAGRALQNMAQSLGVITMDDYRARLRGRT
jgi:hypothetical protein